MKPLFLFTLVLLAAAGHLRADDYVSEPVFFSNYPEKIKGERVPEGAVGYQIIKHNEKVHWIRHNSTTLPFLWWGEKPRPQNDYVRTQQIPKEAIGYAIVVNGQVNGYSIQIDWVTGDTFKDSVPFFPRDKGIGLFAYMQLVDEPVGPRSVDSESFKLPEVNEEWQAKVKKTPFATLRAMFEGAEAGEADKLLANGVVAGKCVYRAVPEVEVGGALVFHREGKEQKAGAGIAARPEEVEKKASAGNPNKYLDLGETGLAELLTEFRADKGSWSAVSAEVPDKRPLPKDSLFFEVRKVGTPGFERGYRLRTLTSPGGKTVYVVEGYASSQGNLHAGRRLKFLEPVVYCVFYQTWSSLK